VHDQTVRLMNHGYKADEIAERLTLPKSLAAVWHTRGYYGSVGHDARSACKPGVVAGVCRGKPKHGWNHRAEMPLRT